MSYNQQLNLIIEKSGKSIKEIAIECKEQGVNITQSYIGILKNNKDRIPSEEISEAISKVCNENPERLIIEGGIDKAPQLLKDKMEAIRDCYKKLMIRFIAPTEELPSDEIMNKIPYYQMLDGFIETINNSLNMVEGNNSTEVENLLKEITEYEIYNDNLTPIINKGKKFKIINIPLNRYLYGDILAFRNNEKLEYKQIVAFNGTYFTLKDNKGFYEVKINEIEPLGIIDMKSVH